MKNKFNIKEIQKIYDLIVDLQIETQKTVHCSNIDYNIENGLIITDNINQIKQELNQKLHKLDTELFNSMDDGR